MESRQMEAGRQRKGSLWSTLEEVFGLLRVSCHIGAERGGPLFQHMQFGTGERVYRMGQAFDNLYIVNSGFLKTVQLDESGYEQVLSFPMKGDLLGADGIFGRRCMSEAVALSACDLIVLPFAKLSALGHAYPEVANALYSIMSRELLHRQTIIGMLGCLSAEARVGRFLVALAERFVEMGYSSKLFNLRMTRLEIGSYLRLTLETVSRTLSAFNEMGLITIHQRSVGINDLEALRNMRRLPPSRALARQERTRHAAWRGRAEPPGMAGSRHG
jgi:CRP/FNR family transcriptional regulator